MEVEILTELKQSRCLALMFDETTDCSVTGQLIIHTRYLDTQGKLRIKYLKVLDSLDGSPEGSFVTVSGKSIAYQITSCIESNDLDYSALVGIGTDGASTMLGKHRGAVKVIRERQMEMQQDDTCPMTEAVGEHCAAHKLNLAASQVGDSVRYIKNFNSVLRQLYDFYNNTSVRSAGLKGSSEAPE